MRANSSLTQPLMDFGNAFTALHRSTYMHAAHFLFWSHAGVSVSWLEPRPNRMSFSAHEMMQSYGCGFLRTCSLRAHVARVAGGVF